MSPIIQPPTELPPDENSPVKPFPPLLWPHLSLPQKKALAQHWAKLLQQVSRPRLLEQEGDDVGS